MAQGVQQPPPPLTLWGVLSLLGFSLSLSRVFLVSVLCKLLRQLQVVIRLIVFMKDTWKSGWNRACARSLQRMLSVLTESLPARTRSLSAPHKQSAIVSGDEPVPITQEPSAPGGGIRINCFTTPRKGGKGEGGREPSALFSTCNRRAQVGPEQSQGPGVVHACA